MSYEEIIATLRGLQAVGHITAYSVTRGEEPDAPPRIWVSWVGPPTRVVEEFLQVHSVSHKFRDQLHQDYYFLSDELRPGSGLIRVFDGKSEGPGGTLTCLLTSKDGQDLYFAAAGHVLTDFWRDTTGQGSIYRYRKGYPPTGSTRFLGKVIYLPPSLPKPINKVIPEPREHVDFTLAGVRKYDPGSEAVLDVGIVKLDVDMDAELKQRTTCYGGFGECPSGECVTLEEDMRVMKCGAQETHWTEAVVLEVRRPCITIYGPDKTRYHFRDQIILRDLYPWELCKTSLPRNSIETPFAVPGDSGAMVVVKETKMPVGMLIAGSLLSGRYVVTPFKEIKKCMFDEAKLVMQRA